MSRRLRVAFVLNPGGTQWMGGVNYMTNLIRAVQGQPDVVPVIFGSSASVPNQYAAMQGLEYHRTSLVDPASMIFLLRKGVARVFSRDLVFERALQTAGVDALSHYGHLGRRSRLPAISWIPDFQHRHLPGFFSKKERDIRDGSFHRIAHNAHRVIFSSEAARSDFLYLYPFAENKARVLRFVSDVGGMRDDLPSRAELEATYGFTGPYLHIPNQFWKHKNHAVVIEACAVARASGTPVCVLATGNTSDARHPTHFETLRARITALGCESDFRVLGMVPYRDLAGLMIHSAGLINPSFFEGWSTTVEEAKSLGKRILLSDIPVHREQAPQHGLYFKADDPEALAQAMIATLANDDPSQESLRQSQAVDDLPERFNAFGRAFADIVLEAVADLRD